MILNSIRIFRCFYSMSRHSFTGIALLLFLVSWVFGGRAYAADKGEDTLDARFSWTMNWEEEVGQSKIQEKGSCVIQVSGKIVKHKEDEEEDKSEFLRYIPKGMNASYKYNNKWHNIDPNDKCYGLVAEEKAFGSVEIGSVDKASGPSNGMLELQVLLGFGGQIHMMQWLASISPEKMLGIGKQPSTDNYTFKLFVPFKTQIQAREECYHIESSLPRSFLFELLIDEYKKKGMSGSFNHSATAHTFQQLGYGSGGGVTRFMPHEGNYNTKSNVSWAFGKVATLQILHWDKDVKKWVNINNETVDVITGEQVKLKARILPEEEGPLTRGQWTIDTGDNKNGKYIKEYDANPRKGEVLRLDAKELQQPDITFYWTDEGKAKVSIEATVGNRLLTTETEFSIRKPKYNVTVNAAKKSSVVTATFNPLKSNNCWVDVQEENLVTQKTKWFQYDGITFTPEPQDGIAGKTQWVQIIESEELTRTWDDFSYETWRLVGEVLDGCYPYPTEGNTAKDEPAQSLERDGDRIRARDSAGKFTDIRLIKTEIKDKFRMYLMFRPKGENNIWVPLKVVKWNYGAYAKFWHVNAQGVNVWETSTGAVTPAQPEAEDTNEYPEWRDDMNAGNPKVYR